MGVVHAFLSRAACAHTIGAVHPPPAILLSCTLPRAPGVRKDGTFESVQHVCERAARTSRVLDMAAVSRLRRSRVGLILSRTYPVLCALAQGRALSWHSGDPLSNHSSYYSCRKSVKDSYGARRSADGERARGAGLATRRGHGQGTE